MSYFGAYFGGSSEVVTTVVTPTTPTAVVSPYEPTAPEFVDHTVNALNRLPEQFRGDK